MWVMTRQQIPCAAGPEALCFFWAMPSPIIAQCIGLVHRYGLENQMLDIPEQAHLTAKVKKKRIPSFLQPDNAANWLPKLEVLLEEYRAGDGKLMPPGSWGFEGDPTRSVVVRKDSQDIRLWPHEFVPNSGGLLCKLIAEDVVEFHMESVAEQELLRGILERNTEQAFVYDAALVDGCTHDQAVAVALGVNIGDEDCGVLPLGWYRIDRKWAKAFL